MKPRFASASLSSRKLSSHNPVILPFSFADKASERTFVFRRESAVISACVRMNRSSAAFAAASRERPTSGSSSRRALRAAVSSAAMRDSITVMAASSASAM